MRAAMRPMAAVDMVTACSLFSLRTGLNTTNLNRLKTGWTTMLKKAHIPRRIPMMKNFPEMNKMMET